jgi:class 3 adenylate cyclase
MPMPALPVRAMTSACLPADDETSVMETPDLDDEKYGQLGRMDFQIEMIRADETTRTALFRVVPDPRRYDKIVLDGDPHYLDKYLRTVISESMMAELCTSQAKGLPLYALSASIQSAPEYAAARRSALDCELEGGSYVPPTERPIAHQTLNCESEEKNLVFLSVDICGSTALRRADRVGFDRAYRLFIRELGTVVGHFNGTLLKVTGDGFIAYIDYPGFTQQCDHSIDMGLSLLCVLRDSINPALRKAGLPSLRIRIGADYGDAIVRQIEVATTGFVAPDISSDALNRAVKIEQSAEEDEFRIGRRLYELIHVQWLERATEVPFDPRVLGVPEYKVYRIH